MKISVENSPSIPANPDQVLIRDALTRDAVDVPIHTSPVLQDLGARFIGGKPGALRFRFTAHERARQGNGHIHGGVLTTMMDSAMAFAALSLIESDESVATISLSVNFMRPALDDVCEVEGMIETAGRRILFAHAAVFSPQGKCIAKAAASMARIMRTG